MGWSCFPSGKPEGFLGAGILVRHLAGQVEHQPNAPGLQGPVEIERQIAPGTPFAGA